jgi:hypothetical protein
MSGRFLRTCRIFAGRHPLHVSAPAIIFFPVTLCQLGCGFAGLMTIKLQDAGPAPTSDLKLAELLEKIKDSNLKKVLTRKLKA